MDTKDDIYGFSPSFKQLPRKHGHAKNGFVLKGEPKFVIKGLKMPPRPYFNYQISAKKAHKKLPDNRSLLKVYDAVIISLPPRKKLMRAMLGIEMDLDGTRIARVLQGVDREIQQRLGGEATEGGSDWYDADAFELLAAMVSELNKLPSEGTVDETAPAGTGPSPMELDFSNAGDLFWNKPAVKMYFYNNAFNQLVDLYDPSDLLCLPKDSILGLLRFAMKNPIPLAMEPRIPFRCVNTIGVTKKGRATGWKLPELSYQKLHKTIKKFGADTIPEDTASVLLYNIMKRNFSDGKNTATGAEALKRDLIRNKKISGADVFEAAVGALVRHGMIVDMRKLAPGADQGVWRDGYLYLANIYAFEKSICAAMVSVCETNVRESTANQEDWKRARGPELQLASAMCDEQWKAMRLFAASPLLYVGGGAGSGKTYFLSRVASLYPGPKVLALAFMNTAVSLLNRNVAPGRSMSCHAFITAHGLECPHSPFRDSPHPGGKCIAKGVEVLVIDEFSVMYAELLAMTLHIFRRCGSLRKVVFTGDHRQLPPIQGGDLLRDFRDGVPWAVVDFTHNHRVSDANFTTIAWNATCIDSGHYGALKTTPFGVGKDHEPVLLLEPDGDGAGCERALVGVLESLQLGEYDHHVITPTNKLRKSLNYVVEQHYLGSQPVENVFHVGRKFVFKMNVPKKNIANNEIMVLDAVWDQHMDTLREDPKNIPPRPLLGAGQSARLAGTLGAQACKGVIHRDSTEPQCRVITPGSSPATASWGERGWARESTTWPTFWRRTRKRKNGKS